MLTIIVIIGFIGMVLNGDIIKMGGKGLGK